MVPNTVIRMIIQIAQFELKFKYAVKVRRHTPWSRGPFFMDPRKMLVHALSMSLSISFATAQSSHNPYFLLFLLMIYVIWIFKNTPNFACMPMIQHCFVKPGMPVLFRLVYN